MGKGRGRQEEEGPLLGRVVLSRTPDGERNRGWCISQAKRHTFDLPSQVLRGLGPAPPQPFPILTQEQKLAKGYQISLKELQFHFNAHISLK